MLNFASNSGREHPRLRRLAIAVLVGVWAAGTIYLDYRLYPYIHDFDADALWSLMLAAPFNVALIWMLVAFVVNLRKTKAHYAMPTIVENGDTVRIKLHPGPVATAVVAFMAATVAGVVFSSFCVCAGMTALVTMSLAWLAAIALTVLSYFRVIRLTTTGHYDITLNLARKTIAVPPSSGKSQHYVIPFMDVLSVHVNEFTTDEGQTWYRAVLHWRDADGALHQATLKETFDNAEAEALVACIRADVERCRQNHVAEREH